MIDITWIIEAVFVLGGVLVMAVVIPFVRSKTTAHQRAELSAWVKIAVEAAEQIYSGAGRGEEKKDFVLDWLREHGVTVDEKKLDAIVEAAVYELGRGLQAEGAA